MKKEYDFKKMKLRRRGPLAAPNAKVMKTFRMDLDILAWLQKEGERSGVGYQTAMMMILRKTMHGEANIVNEQKIREIVQEELKKVI